jgi:hypothetical protein
MKTALIIDGNYLLSKDVFILTHLRTLHIDLEKLLRLDIQKLMKLFPFDKVYFISDSKHNWRKYVLPTYKSNRKKDDKIDWKWVYTKFDELKADLSNNKKVIQLEIDSAEGDDIISYIIKKNNISEWSNLIIASDSDLHQLLKFDIHNNFINIMYNYKFSDERLYMPQNYNIYLNNKNKPSSLFDMDDDETFVSMIERLNKKTKTIEVNVNNLIFKKMVSGDTGDNIKSCYLKTTKSGKKSGIGKSGSETLFKLYKEVNGDNIDFDNDLTIDKIVDLIVYTKKITDITVINEIKENLKLNRKLTILTDKYLPDYLLNEFKNTIII